MSYSSLTKPSLRSVTVTTIDAIEPSIMKFKRPQYAKRHDKVIFQHGNARAHVAKVVKETLEALKWDVLPHPPYSPDIAPSDYHLFRLMAHGLAEQHINSYEEAKKNLKTYLYTQKNICLIQTTEKFSSRNQKWFVFYDFLK